jgi:hypothetical protein
MNLGSGNTYSENMSAASGGRGGSQNQGPSGFGGGNGYSGPTYDEAGTTITTAQLSNIGPTQFGDSFVDTIKDYLGQRPTVSRGIGGLLGSIIGNAFLPGIGGLLGGYLGQGRAQNYLNQYNLTRDTERDYLGGTLGRSIYTPPGGINNIRTNPNIINPNTIPDFNDPFYSNMLYAEAPKARMPSSGYDPRQKEKDDALELYYQENPELRPPEQGNLFGSGITSIV